MYWAYSRYRVRLFVMVVPQTFGGLLNFHPHLHVLVSAGGLREGEARWIPRLKFDKEELMKCWKFALIAYLGRLADVLSSEPEQLKNSLEGQYARKWNIFVSGAVSIAVGLLEYLQPSLVGIDLKLAARHGIRTTLAWCVFAARAAVAALLPLAGWSMIVCLALDLFGCALPPMQPDSIAASSKAAVWELHWHLLSAFAADLRELPGDNSQHRRTNGIDSDLPDPAVAALHEDDKSEQRQDDAERKYRQGVLAALDQHLCPRSF
jgi:hypothetical protein